METECGNCGEDPELDHEAAEPLDEAAVLFECLNGGVWDRGTIVQMVGFGRAAPEDETPGIDQGDWFIHGWPVHFEGMSDASAESLAGGGYYFTAEDLRPLTAAAKVVLDELAERRAAARRWKHL